MKPFALFLADGSVRTRTPEPSHAHALKDEAENRARFLKTIPSREENANYILENAYDILRAHIEAKMLLAGYKSYSHEATVAYLYEIGGKEGDVRFVDEMRQIRNGIKYDGKKTTLTYAKKAVSFVNAYRGHLLK